MSEIKNIILDLGGVIIDLDFNKSHDKFREMGLNEISEPLLKSFFDFEAGLISKDDLFNAFHNEREGLSEDKIIEAWCLLLRELPQHRVDYLSKLGKQYPLYLLSNTNSLHINYLKERENSKFEKFESSFEKIFYSFEMDSRKPDPIIFEKLIADLNIKPEESIFVDDMKENIETAKSLGFQTWLFDVEKDEIMDLDKVLNNY